jgi:hypothetical protein
MGRLLPVETRLAAGVFQVRQNFREGELVIERAELAGPEAADQIVG